MCRASCHRSLARVSPFLSLCFPSGGGKEAEACHVVNGVEGQSTHSLYRLPRGRGQCLLRGNREGQRPGNAVIGNEG